MATERELCVDPILDGQQTQLLEPLDLEPRERLELQIGERPPPPQALRLAQQRRRPSSIPTLKRRPPIPRQTLEPLQVELSRVDAQQIPRRSRDQPWLSLAIGKRLAQPRDLHSQHPLERPRRLVRQQLIDQLIARENPVGVAQQQRQQRALPRPADSHQRAIDAEPPTAPRSGTQDARPRSLAQVSRKSTPRASRSTAARVA